MTDTFQCGHARTPKNSRANGKYVKCALCDRTRRIRLEVDKVLARWKKNEMTGAERIVHKYCRM